MTEKKAKTTVICRRDGRMDQYSALAHKVASADYKKTLTYVTNNRRLVFTNDKAYLDSVLVAVVDRKKETIAICQSVYSNTVGWSVAYAFRSGFDHFNKFEVLSLDLKEARVKVKSDIIMAKAQLKRSNYMGWHQINRDYEGFKELCLLKNVSDPLLDKLKDIIEEHNQLMKERNERESERRQKSEEAYKKRTEDAWLKVKEVIEQELSLHPELTTAVQKYKYLKSLRFTKEAIQDNFFNQKQYFNYTYTCQDACYELDLKYDDRVRETLGVRKIHYPSGNERWPDMVWYELDSDTFMTSQGVRVEVRGLVNRVLDTVIEAFDKNDKELMESTIGKSVGSFEIREFDWNTNTIRVGCHVFTIENLKELQKYYYDNGTERRATIKKIYEDKIEQNRKRIAELQQEVCKWNAKIKLLTE